MLVLARDIFAAAIATCLHELPFALSALFLKKSLSISRRLLATKIAEAAVNGLLVMVAHKFHLGRFVVVYISAVAAQSGFPGFLMCLWVLRAVGLRWDATHTRHSLVRCLMVPLLLSFCCRGVRFSVQWYFTKSASTGAHTSPTIIVSPRTNTPHLLDSWWLVVEKQRGRPLPDAGSSTSLDAVFEGLRPLDEAEEPVRHSVVDFPMRWCLVATTLDALVFFVAHHWCWVSSSEGMPILHGDLPTSLAVAIASSLLRNSFFAS